MFGLAEYAIRLLGRYGALAGFVVMAALSIGLLIVFLRSGVRPSSTMTSTAFAFTIAIIGAAALAKPALEATMQIRRAIIGPAIPAPSGPLAITDQDIVLSAPGAAPIEAHLWRPADAARAPHRLVLYAPGLGGTRLQNALLAAELASHGYVVLAIDDLSQNPAPPGEGHEAAAIREGRFDYSTEAAYEASLSRGDARAALYAERARDALDRFSAIASAPDALWGAIDTSRVVFLGYSFGAAAGAELAHDDPRITALINLDGALYGAAAREGVSQPYLLILSDMRSRLPVPQAWRRSLEYRLIARELEAAAAQARRPYNEILEVRLAPHAAFADAYFEPRWHWRDWLLLDPQRAYAIVHDRVLAFLQLYAPHGGPVATSPQHFDEVLELEGRPA